MFSHPRSQGLPVPQQRSLLQRDIPARSPRVSFLRSLGQMTGIGAASSARDLLSVPDPSVAGAAPTVEGRSCLSQLPGGACHPWPVAASLHLPPWSHGHLTDETLSCRWPHLDSLRWQRSKFFPSRPPILRVWVDVNLGVSLVSPLQAPFFCIVHGLNGHHWLRKSLLLGGACMWWGLAVTQTQV